MGESMYSTLLRQMPAAQLRLYVDSFQIMRCVSSKIWTWIHNAFRVSNRRSHIAYKFPAQIVLLHEIFLIQFLASPASKINSPAFVHSQVQPAAHEGPDASQGSASEQAFDTRLRHDLFGDLDASLA